MKGKTMWYIQIDNTILPTPYQYFSDCLAECKRIQREMVAVFVNPVNYKLKEIFYVEEF